MRSALPLLGCALLACACAGDTCTRQPATPTRTEAREAPAPSAAAVTETDALRSARERMVEDQLRARGIDDARVLDAMRRVPRHAFVREQDQDEAYDDHPLPIAADQTISQPYIVALMTQLAAVSKGHKVLEVGTGSGYQAAVLAALGARVFSIEIIEELARTADARLEALGYEVQVRHGDGYAGWPDQAPFDAILVTAAPPKVPEPLRQQLALGGRLIVPVGDTYQELMVITKTEQGYLDKRVLPVRFVPMTGKAQEQR